MINIFQRSAIKNAWSKSNREYELAYITKEKQKKKKNRKSLISFKYFL